MTKKTSLSESNPEDWAIAPNGLKKLILFALDQAGTHNSSEYDDSLFPGFYWRGNVAELFGGKPYGSGRYCMTPPELFPFAGLGEDGIHYGYVVHAPELSGSNSPIGIFDPSGLVEGVKLLGANFEHALDRLLSEALGFYSTDKELQTIHAIASLLKVQPNLDKRNPRYMEYHDPILPVIPPGWHYESSSDGIGVLAPHEAFIPNSPTCESWSFDISQGKGYPVIQDVEAAFQFAEKCFERNAPASALFVLRELYWRSSDDRVFIRSKELWKNAYSQLGRPLLSRIVEQEAESRQKWLEQAYELSSEYEVIGTVFESVDEEKS